jgi:hypothetical protein
MMPSCGKEWSRKFIKEKFTNSFLTNEYKEHLETILFNKEKALLPATQLIVEEKIRKQNIKKEMRNIDDLIHELQKQKRDLEAKLYNRTYTKEKTDENVHRFVRQCPADGCRGFLSTQWKCGLCENWTCPDCHELKGPKRDCEHTCDPNSVETAKLLSKDSKPCPKCQSLIFKIEGCDQMWCTQCRTAFSWRTGKLETHIHNPHYYEWMRKNNGGVVPRTHGDVPPAHQAEIRCGQELTEHVSNQIMVLGRKYGLSVVTRHNGGIDYKLDSRIELICNIICNTIHNTRAELPTFQTDHFERNQELRIRYLEGLIDDDEFKKLIQRADKKNRKNIEISQIITLCNTAVTDIIHRFYDYLKNYKPNMVNKPNFEPFIQEIKQIRNYCNNILREIAFTYNCVEYIFVEYFHFEKVINIKCVNEKSSKKESVHKESVHKESVHKESVHKESVHKEAVEVEEKNVILPKKASKSKNILLVIDDDDDENIVLSKKT